jgi:hypothetical protein
MVAHAIAVCDGCGEEFPSAGYDHGLCPRCQSIEDDQYATVLIVDTEPWKYSRSTMQERLGVTGDRDE